MTDCIDDCLRVSVVDVSCPGVVLNGLGSYSFNRRISSLTPGVAGASGA
eukprot:CAMPEP_0174863874 /NCGR_PEP_ID=MMETSP1114-20130205/57140_2 /TAXON_ID=312471 /ORGANISM="Neobodo designis, Strain CCAP 1951/1" /LENGTH=48 /DNA_ID= /DNA_START= /DNA_END= /DNA_ORIENTATION=